MRLTRARFPALLALVCACGDAGPEVVLEIQTPSSTEVTVGDLLVLSVVASGSTASVSWTSSNGATATVTGGTVEALRPGPVVITATASGAVPDEIELTVVERPGGYNADEVDYFAEIAFGSEFGGASPALRRWSVSGAPTIRINGGPSPGDREVVDSVLAEINRLTPLDVQLVDDAPSVEMHFVPEDQFDDVFPEAPPGNIGLVWVWWGADQYIYQSIVLIATDVSESIRAHIIREELTQMLGLLRDSFSYPESIFYQGFSTVTAYLPIDEAVIEVQHRPELQVGWSVQRATREARRLLRAESPSGIARADGPTATSLGAARSDGATGADQRPVRGAPGSAGSGVPRR